MSYAEAFLQQALGKDADTVIPPSPDEMLTALGRNEDGDAELFVRLQQGKLVFDHTDRRWYEFTGHFWKLDRKNNSLAAVSSVIDLYSVEAKRQGDLKHKATIDNRKDDADQHGKLEKELLKRVSKLHGRQRKENVLNLASAGDQGLTITGEEWEQHPYLLACPNGVLDLQTGVLRQGRPEDYIKTVTTTPWAGIDIPCPTWERFLLEVFDRDEEVISYVQTLMGYGLIGATPLHIIPIFWGRGRNGKGTLLETVKHVLGSYAYKAEAEMLLDQKFGRSSNSHNSGVLALQGKRIVWTSEVDEGRRFNAAKVKELVGGDTLSGRAPYGRDHKEFRPSHLLILLTNAKPSANPADYALWQRIHLVEFSQSFVENPTEPHEQKADQHLPEKLKAEASGILAWMVHGCLRFNQEKLRVPEKVMAAVARYREEEDLLGHFISERCIQSEALEVQKGELYKAYTNWCDDNGQSALGGKRFYQQMDERFDNYDKGGRRFFYTGIGLLSL